ncbi:MAG: hypothetical protein M3Q30_26075 [Actinomycetota bacterium]|nr:hypothetical protein [Actinomycetota bacterium]
MAVRRSVLRAIAVAALVIGTVVIVIATVATPAAATTSPIGPKQHYIGLVNAEHAGAVIYVVCPGPAGRSGPPAGGQTVAVRRVPSGGGYTGTFAHQIWAQFGSDQVHVVGFTAYDVAKPIPTSLRLPCQGTGTVTFTTCFGTKPCAANSKPDTVTVTFENIAV